MKEQERKRWGKAGAYNGVKAYERENLGQKGTKGEKRNEKGRVRMAGGRREEGLEEAKEGRYEFGEGRKIVKSLKIK